MHEFLWGYQSVTNLEIINISLAIVGCIASGVGVYYSYNANKNAAQVADAISDTHEEMRLRDMISELEYCKSEMNSSVQNYSIGDYKSSRIYIEHSCEFVNKVGNYPFFKEQKFKEDYKYIQEVLTEIRTHLTRLENNPSESSSIPSLQGLIRTAMDKIDVWVGILRNGELGNAAKSTKSYK